MIGMPVVDPAVWFDLQFGAAVLQSIPQNKIGGAPVIVYFLRHASAGQSTMDAESDGRRPLDKEGIEQCLLIGQTLASLDVALDEIISSPLQRAAQTATLTAKEMGYKGEITYSPAMALETNFQQFQQLLREHLEQKAIMVVGHNPRISQFLSLALSAGGNDSGVEMKKGAIAKVEIGGRGQGSLHWFLTPKLVRSIQEAATTSSRPKTSRK
jgi:phosphohistidine phosphatase